MTADLFQALQSPWRRYGYADTINPILIMLSAVTPNLSVSGFAVNIPNSVDGIIHESAVPKAIIIADNKSAVLYICLTRLCSPAP